MQTCIRVSSQTAKLKLQNSSVNCPMNKQNAPDFLFGKVGGILFVRGCPLDIAACSGVSGFLLLQTVEEIRLCLIAGLAVFTVQVQVEHVAV